MNQYETWVQNQRLAETSTRPETTSEIKLNNKKKYIKTESYIQYYSKTKHSKQPKTTHTLMKCK